MKKWFIWMAATMLLLTTSCNKEKGVPSVLQRVHVSNLTLTAAQQQVVIPLLDEKEENYVLKNVAVVVTDAATHLTPAWCLAETDGQKSLVVSVEENTSINSRTANITLFDRSQYYRDTQFTESTPGGLSFHLRQKGVGQ